MIRKLRILKISHSIKTNAHIALRGKRGSKLVIGKTASNIKEHEIDRFKYI